MEKDIIEEVTEDKLEVYRLCPSVEYNKKITSLNILKIFNKPTYEEETTQKYLFDDSFIYLCIAKSFQEAVNKYKKDKNVEKIKRDTIRYNPGINHSFRVVEMVTDHISLMDLYKLPHLEVAKYLQQELGGSNNA